MKCKFETCYLILCMYKKYCMNCGIPVAPDLILSLYMLTTNII